MKSGCRVFVLAALSLALVAGTSAQQQRQLPAQQKPRVHREVQPQAHTRPYPGRDTWYEFLLKQFNPVNLDYGASIEQRRQAFLEARVRNPYFGYSLFATLALCLMTAVCTKMWIDHRRALWATAEWMADVYNHDLYSREAAREAIQRYNDHIERCNRVIEAGESGHSTLGAGAAEAETLRAELQRVGDELTAAKRENEIIQEQLRTKSALVAQMSLRLDGLGKKSRGNADATQGTDLREANPDLLKHINGLEQQLYAERQALEQQLVFWPFQRHGSAHSNTR